MSGPFADAMYVAKDGSLCLDLKTVAQLPGGRERLLELARQARVK